MKDFNYYAPTEVVFGEQSEEQVALLVKKYGGTKVLVHYGGQSAVRSGLLDKIYGILQEGGIPFVKLGGVVPNPRLSLAHEGIALCRQEGVDFILAVGGGSVIDSAKCHRLLGAVFGVDTQSAHVSLLTSVFSRRAFPCALSFLSFIRQFSANCRTGFIILGELYSVNHHFQLEMQILSR